MRFLAFLSFPLSILLKLSLLSLLFLVLGGPSVIDNTRASNYTNGTICEGSYYRGGAERNDVLMFMCKDPKTGRIQKVNCKNPPKSIMPPKDRPTVMTMAELKKACGLLDGMEDTDMNG